MLALVKGGISCKFSMACYSRIIAVGYLAPSGALAKIMSITPAWYVFTFRRRFVFTPVDGLPSLFLRRHARNDSLEIGFFNLGIKWVPTKPKPMIRGNTDCVIEWEWEII